MANGKIYANQDFELTLQTGVTLTGGAVLIKYILFDGTEGEKTAAISGTEDVVYNFINTDITVIGDATFWVKATISGKIYFGEPVTFRIYEEGN